MAQNQLRDFFREKKQKAKPADVDWGAKRDAWIEAVEDLYRTIESDFLKAAKDDVEVAYADKVVNENCIGQYKVRELELRVGDERVVFSPKGVNIVGAKGRIDVEGDRGEATIVWEGDGDWSIVLARTPALRLVRLNAESLAELLRGIMRP